jgi:hypothetical protein
MICCSPAGLASQLPEQHAAAPYSRSGFFPGAGVADSPAEAASQFIHDVVDQEMFF